MSNVQQDIRSWLHQQQDWFQQAAEQLLTSGPLSEGDVQAITDRLKTAEGRQRTTHRTFDALTEGGLYTCLDSLYFCRCRYRELYRWVAFPHQRRTLFQNKFLPLVAQFRAFSGVSR